MRMQLAVVATTCCHAVTVRIATLIPVAQLAAAMGSVVQLPPSPPPRHSRHVQLPSDDHRAAGATGWRWPRISSSSISNSNAWSLTPQVDAFQGGKGGGGAAAHWHTLGKTENATECAMRCEADMGWMFAWHHPPEQMCHCSAEVHGWEPTTNIRVDSGCREQGCLPPGPPPPPGLPPWLLPRWIGPLPDPALPTHGLRQLQGTRHVTIYNSSLADGSPNPDGLYNHGPMLLYVQRNLSVDTSLRDRWIACWYNGPQREAHLNRVVFSVGSTSATNWSRPMELFPSVNGHGEENEPFALINGRLYGTASDVLLNNEHDSGTRGGLMMRRIHGTAHLGPIFWASNVVPPDINGSRRYPLYSEMDGTTAQDTILYLSSLVNETVRHGDSAAGPGTVAFNERSMYVLPRTKRTAGTATDQVGKTGGGADERELVMLLRYGGGKPMHATSLHTQLWGARCVLPPPTLGPAKLVPVRTQAGTFSCRSGTGAYDFEIPSSSNAALWLRKDGDGDNEIGPPAIHVRQCNWSTPSETNLPDAPSRTCAGQLPNGLGIGLVGNQGETGRITRDPLTFCVAKDGLNFDEHWVVVSGAPKPKWFGYRGFQYPSFTWCTTGCRPSSTILATTSHAPASATDALTNVILFTYSVSKEDIVLTMAPLSSLD